MFIPDPDFCPSRIPDPKTATKERSEKNLNLLSYLFWSHKYHKLKIILFLNWRRKKILAASLQKIIEISLKFVVPIKLSLSSQTFWFRVRDPGSRKKPISDPVSGVKKAPDPVSGSATLDLCLIIPGYHTLSFLLFNMFTVQRIQMNHSCLPVNSSRDLVRDQIFSTFILNKIFTL